MRRYSFTMPARSISALNHRYHGTPLPTSGPIVEVKPLIDQYTPGQQLWLLEWRGGPLALAILAKLKHSTIVPAPGDRDALLAQRLVIRKANGSYVLTPQGMWISSRLMRELADAFGVDPLHHKPRTRGMYSPGVKARFHFW